MKKLHLIPIMLLLIVPMIFSSCKKDEDNTPIVLVPKLSGLYVFGTNTLADVAVDPNAKMARAVLNTKNGGPENREGIYGKLMYIGASSTIQFTSVDSLGSANYGATDGGTVSPGPQVGLNDINADIIHGTLLEDAAAINIADEGLYYVYVDFNTLEFRIMQVKAQMIGDATELQWTAGTPLPQVFVSKDSAVFEITNMPLVGSSGYKYRFNNGWELFNDGSIFAFTHLGVESYGDSWDAGVNNIGYFNENIPHKENGMFTIRLKYNASNGEWKETKTKTSNLLINYSANQMGLFGNAYVLAPGDTANWGSGTDGYGLHIPVKSGNIYTWTWNNVDLIEGREFIFLEDGGWGGLQYDWAMLTSVGGLAVTEGKIVDATTTGGEWHNFQVITGGKYNITLAIDAENDTKTVTIVSAP